MPRTKKAPPESLAEDQALVQIREESDGIVEFALGIANVEDTESEARAAEFLKRVKILVDNAETARTRLVKPLNDHVKMINAEFKKTTGPLAEADELVRHGMIAYRNSVMFKEAEARRLALESEGKRVAREGDVGELQRIAGEHAEASAAAPRKVETASGEARFRKTWRFEITDLEQLPAGYWMPDEDKIKKTVQMGMPIPGVRAWVEETPIIV